jgi:hypothetical protein
MAKVLISDQYLTEIGEAIRTKLESAHHYTPAQMGPAILSIPVGGSAAPILQSKTIAPSANQQVITADSGYDALSSVTISPVSSTTLNVSSNGTYTATSGTFYSTVNVSIADSEVILQSKTATPSNVPVAVTPDSGYHGLSSVTINPIPSNYADISNTTAMAGDVLAGETFVDANGTPKTGLLVTSSYYVGSSTPSSSLGSDVDLYLKG